MMEADRLEKSGRSLEAVKIHKQILKLCPKHTNSLLEIGVYHEGGGRYKLAKDFYLRAIASNPESAIAYANLGNLILKGTTTLCYAEALAYLIMALRLDCYILSAYRGLSFCYEGLGKEKQALECAEQCLKIDPEDRPSLARVQDLRRRFNIKPFQALR